MAPREKYQVHSFRDHYSKAKASKSTSTIPSRPAPAIKNENNSNAIFGNKDGSDESSSEDDSDDEPTNDFLNSLQKKKGALSSNKRLGKDDEIADSDVERQASAKKAGQKSGGAPVKPEASSSDTSSDDESDSDEVTKKKTNGASATTSSSSDSSDEDSDSESEEGPIEKAAKQPEEPKAVESDAEDDTSSSDSSDEDDEEPPETAKPEAAPLPNGTSASKTTSTSTSSEESSSEEDSSEDEDDEQADVSMHIADRQNTDRTVAPAVMGPDFMLRKGDQGLNGKDVADVFNSANLQGKQLWYFTVPSNVPVSVVQNMEFQVDNAQRGDRVLSHGGEDYGISFDSGITKSTIQILVPSANGPEYQSSNRQVDQVMQVKRLPQIGAPTSQAAVAAPPVAARPQPEGLRARYKPIGVYDAAPKPTIAQQDVEMTDAPAPLSSGKGDKKTAKAEKKTKKDKSKKAADTIEVPSSQQHSQESVDPSSLKRKVTTSEEDAELAAQQLAGESSAAASKRKKQKTERVGSPELGSETAPSKKVAPVVAPTPTQDTTTPTKKAKKDKKDKKSAAKSAVNSLEDPDSNAAKKQTPVPLPKFPGSSQLGLETIPSSQPTPTVKKDKSKKEKKEKKDKKAAVAEGAAAEKKTTPVPLPQQGSSS